MSSDYLDEKWAKVLLELFDADHDYCYTYANLKQWTQFDLKTLKEIITGLRKAGLVEHVKGLMDDEGMVAGSGFQIPYKERNRVVQILAFNGLIKPNE